MVPPSAQRSFELAKRRDKLRRQVPNACAKLVVSLAQQIENGALEDRKLDFDVRHALTVHGGGASTQKNDLMLRGLRLLKQHH